MPVLISVAVLVLVALGAAGISAAQDLRQTQKKYKEVQRGIKAHEEKLKKAREAERSTLGALDSTNRKLSKVRRELGRYREELRKTEGQIKSVNAEIAALNAKLQRRRDWMTRKLRAMHRTGRYGDVIAVLGASQDADELLRRWRYLESLAEYERALIEDHRKTIRALDDKEKELEGLRQRLAAEEDRVFRAEQDLAREKARKQKILASVKQKKAAYERMLRELRAASKKLRKVIEDSARDKRFASKEFRKRKGALPWPVYGRVAIPYGTQKDPTFKTPVFRNGIYIASGPGSVARAVHAGKVVYADWFKGYGQLIIVNHGGGYHTLYANLSEIFLREGDIIKGSDEIGRVGDSSVTERPSLYFEIRYKGKPLDPVQWLRRK